MHTIGSGSKRAWCIREYRSFANGKPVVIFAQIQLGAALDARVVGRGVDHPIYSRRFSVHLCVLSCF